MNGMYYTAPNCTVPCAVTYLFGPRPAGSDPPPGIFGILGVDPRFSLVFIGLPREFLEFRKLSLALRKVPLDGKGVLVVHVDPKFSADLFPQVVLVVGHGVVDTPEVSAVQGQHREPVDEFFVGGNLLVV